MYTCKAYQLKFIRMSLKKYTYEVKHEEKDNYQSKNHCNGKHTEIGDRKMRGKHFLKTHSLTGCLFPERILRGWTRNTGREFAWAWRSSHSSSRHATVTDIHISRSSQILSGQQTRSLVNMFSAILVFAVFFFFFCHPDLIIDKSSNSQMLHDNLHPTLSSRPPILFLTPFLGNMIFEHDSIVQPQLVIPYTVTWRCSRPYWGMEQTRWT